MLLLDGRARQVEHDTGRVLGGCLRKDLKALRNVINSWCESLLTPRHTKT